TAAILSITFFLPFLLTSASINVLFAAIVDKRSSSKKTGRENFFFNRLAYLSEKIARSLKEPFICFGRPITIFETSYSCIKLFSSLSVVDISFSFHYIFFILVFFFNSYSCIKLFSSLSADDISFSSQ